MKRIPATVLCGFLGAGKTTLLRRLLEQPEGTRFGVLVNDFGAIDIDSELIASTDASTISLANGCICCSIQDDLIAAAHQILDGDPEHLVVEASGVSRPLSILAALEVPGLAERIRVDAVICVADAEQFGALDYASTELAIDQAVSSDLVLVNKCDLASQAQIDLLERTLKGPMPNLKLVRTVQAEVPRALLLGPQTRSTGHAHRRDEARPKHDAHHRDDGHHHGDVQHHHGEHRHEHRHEHHHKHADEFESWSWTTDQLLDEAAFRQTIGRLPPSLLRAKGIVSLAAGNGARRAVFHLVGKRHVLDVDVDVGAGAASDTGASPAPSRVVAIARSGSIDAASLDALFDSTIQRR